MNSDWWGRDRVQHSEESFEIVYIDFGHVKNASIFTTAIDSIATKWFALPFSFSVLPVFCPNHRSAFQQCESHEDCKIVTMTAMREHNNILIMLCYAVDKFILNIYNEAIHKIWAKIQRGHLNWMSSLKPMSFFRQRFDRYFFPSMKCNFHIYK